MALKVLRFISLPCYKSTSKLFYLFELNSKLLKYLPCHLCHSNSLENSLDNPEIQKYLQFIQTDQTFIQRVHNSQQNRFQDLLNLLEKKKEIHSELDNLKKMSIENDKELEKLKLEEKDSFLKQIETLDQEIYEKMLPEEDKNEDRDIEIHIIPSVGGNEAKLFAEELYHMYLNYVDYKNWNCVICELRGQKSDLRSGYIRVSGSWVFNHMKYEAGVHRVQRVPATEKSGRTHTSTCTVMILPQPKPFEIVIHDRDIVVEKMRSSAPGGQNVNKTESCIRIKHLPTGIAVENQTSRYQYENHKMALEKLRGILFNIEQEKITSERKALQKQQAGTQDYSDKIRTYHYIQNRVTDHRINYSTHNLKGFLSGSKELDVMLYKLKEHSKKEQLQNHIAEVFDSAEYKNFKKNLASN